MKLARYLSLPFFGEIAAAGRRIGQYAQASIDRYHSLLQNSDEKAPRTLFTKIWAYNELSPDDIRNEAQAYIVAGSDTTAVTLTYLVYNVCKNDSIRQKLLEELASLPKDFRDKDLRNLPYLDHVATETLRLNAPVAASLPRAVPPEGARLAGYHIPGGITVSTQAYTLHRLKDIFEDPHRSDSQTRLLTTCRILKFWFRFNPDRWATPSKEMKDAMMAFGGGARSKSNVECPCATTNTDSATLKSALVFIWQEWSFVLRQLGFSRDFHRSNFLGRTVWTIKTWNKNITS